MVASEFFAALYPGWSAGWLALWRGDTKATKWLGPDLAGLEPLVAECSATAGANLYYGVGLQREISKGRGTADGVLAIPGLWADVDCAEAAGSKKAKKKYPPLEVATKVLAELPVQPSVIVESGGGLHVYWLFHELLPATAGAAVLVRGWQAVLARALERAGGYALDATHDLARVLRVPGSMNHAHGRPVTVHGEFADPATWRRYEPADFEGFLIEEPAAAPHKSNGAITNGVVVVDGSLRLDPQANPPSEKLEALRENSPEFRRCWAHTGKDYPSTSEREAALARFAREALWSDQEIADLLIAHRRRWEPEKLGKMMRPDVIPRVLRLVGSDSNRDAAIRELNGLPTEPGREVVAPVPEKPTQASKDDRAGRLASLSAVFGVQVAGWIQSGIEKPLYSLLLADGRDIPIGPPSAVLDGCKGIQAALYTHLGHTMEPVKAKAWIGVCRSLAAIREVHEAIESTDAETVRHAITDYLRRKDYYGSSQKDLAAQEGAPFIEGDRIYLSLMSLRKSMSLHVSDRFTRPQLCEAMRRLGFEPNVVAHAIPGSDKRTSRLYWRGPIEQFESAIAARLKDRV